MIYLYYIYMFVIYKQFNDPSLKCRRFGLSPVPCNHRNYHHRCHHDLYGKRTLNVLLTQWAL